jgi:hypothetical protein
VSRHASTPLLSAVVAVAAAAFTAVCARAEADAPSWLRWTAPARCPSAARVAEEIGSQLARHGKSPRGLTVQGEVNEQAQGYALVLGLRHDGVSATRTLEASSCEELSRAAAFLVALGADSTPSDERAGTAPPTTRVEPRPPARPRSERGQPVARRVGSAQNADSPAAPPLETPRTEPAASPEPPPAPAPPPVEPAAPPPQPVSPAASAASAPSPEVERPSAPRTPLRLLFAPRGLFADLTLGVWGSGLPGPTGSVALAFGADFGPLRTALGAAVALPRDHDTPAGTLHSLALQFALDTCYVRTLGEAVPVELAGCAELGLIQSRVEAPSLTGTGKDSAMWLTLGPAVRAGVPLWGRFGARLELGLALPLSARPSFDAEGLGPLLEAGFVSGYARLGLGARF